MQVDEEQNEKLYDNSSLRVLAARECARRRKMVKSTSKLAEKGGYEVVEWSELNQYLEAGSFTYSP
jgi:hypothetical protein